MVEAISLCFANIARDYMSAMKRRVLLQNLLGIPRFRSAQFWGAYLGFRHETTVRTRLKRRFYYPKGFNSLRKPH